MSGGDAGAMSMNDRAGGASVLDADAVADAVRTGPAAAARLRAETSPGFASWLTRHRAGMVCSSFQTGQLIFLGVDSNGHVISTTVAVPTVMSVAAFSQRLYLVDRTRIWRFENALPPDQVIEGRFDRLFVSRNAQVTGNVSAHEIVVAPSGRIVFTSAKYACLATLSPVRSFRAVWKPPFISKLAPEDRCHLNGVCGEGERIRYVTACAATDIVDGWRDHRRDGGVVIDVEANRIVAEGLSMPHSPRLHDGVLWVLDAGSGHLCRIDPQTGRRENVAFCPGFLRGLTFTGPYAVLTASLPRYGRFQGLLLDDELARRKAVPWCGVFIIDLRTGDIAEWVRLGAGYTELVDVGLIPNVRCPTGLAPDSPQMQDAITFEDGCGEAKAGV
jgi:uncharacterized protein (TIGR03032 family)